jgi:tetratricopeptide (TPR) repeat protein
MWGGNPFVYSNPFWVAPTNTNNTTIVQVPVSLDYSHPIEPPTNDWFQPIDGAEVPLDPDLDPEIERAVELFDEARAAFKTNNYEQALRLVDKAIELLPSDATLHEFRGLCLFAMEDFQQAAATIYAVLAAGPGWNWDTLASLYPDTATHTAQLRALETHVRANPDDAAAAFLLAYHYLTMDYVDEAVMMWERVERLLPDDPLVGQLLEAFGQAEPTGQDPEAATQE